MNALPTEVNTSEVTKKKAGIAMQVNSHQGARRENARPTNRIANRFFLMLAGGRFRSYSLLKHIGRRSGREYSVPVSAFPLGDGLVMALLYGDASTVDWCRNVMAAGKCIIKTRGQEYLLERPEIVPASMALEAFPLPARLIYKAEGIKEFLWVHHQSEVSQ